MNNFLQVVCVLQIFFLAISFLICNDFFPWFTTIWEQSGQNYRHIHNFKKSSSLLLWRKTMLCILHSINTKHFSWETNWNRSVAIRMVVFVVSWKIRVESCKILYIYIFDFLYSFPLDFNSLTTSLHFLMKTYWSYQLHTYPSYNQTMNRKLYVFISGLVWDIPSIPNAPNVHVNKLYFKKLICQLAWH
jgi:hypothetical protein